MARKHEEQSLPQRQTNITKIAGRAEGVTAFDNVDTKPRDGVVRRSEVLRAVNDLPLNSYGNNHALKVVDNTFPNQNSKLTRGQFEKLVKPLDVLRPVRAAVWDLAHSFDNCEPGLEIPPDLRRKLAKAVEKIGDEVEKGKSLDLDKVLGHFGLGKPVTGTNNRIKPQNAVPQPSDDWREQVPDAPLPPEMKGKKPPKSETQFRSPGTREPFR